MTRRRLVSIRALLMTAVALSAGWPAAAQQTDAAGDQQAETAPADQTAPASRRPKAAAADQTAPPEPAAPDNQRPKTAPGDRTASDAQRPKSAPADRTSPDAQAKEERADGAGAAEAVGSSNGLAMALYPVLPREGNIAFSPYNLAATLELLGRGARGATAEEIRRTLGLKDDPAAGSEAYERLWAELEAAVRGGPGFSCALRDDSVVVSRVIPSSPAALATLRPGDEILAVDGRAVASPADVERAIEAASKGVVLRVKSGEAEADLHLTAAAPPSLFSAYGLWVQEGAKLNPEFARLVKYRPAAVLERINFTEGSPHREINAWIAEATHQKIPDLFPQLPHDTQFVLAGVLYFKGDWASPFDAKLTREGSFHVDKGTTVEATMMRAPELSARVVEFPAGGAVAIELPYAGGALAMDLIVPRDADGLKALESALNPESLAALQRDLDAATAHKVDLTMPRFKASTRLDLGPTLATLGMGSAFGDSADFSGIVTEGPIRISKVYHQTVIEVNETGTEAAAATGIAGVRFAPRVLELTVDRPFIHLVRDKATGAVLFMGRISNPSEAN